MKKTTVIIIIAVVLIIMAGAYFLNKGNIASNMSASQTQAGQADANLTSAVNDLDSVDLNSLDSDLNQNDRDTTAF